MSMKILEIFLKKVPDKLLRNKAFDIPRDPKHDGYQREFGSLVYNLFDKKIL